MAISERFRFFPKTSLALCVAHPLGPFRVGESSSGPGGGNFDESKRGGEGRFQNQRMGSESQIGKSWQPIVAPWFRCVRKDCPWNGLLVSIWHAMKLRVFLLLIEIRTTGNSKHIFWLDSHLGCPPSMFASFKAPFPDLDGKIYRTLFFLGRAP